jgi:transcriptional regulator with XRE-family HTH domain
MDIRNNEEILSELSARIKKYRIRNKLSQKELSRKAGVNINTIGRAESGGQVSLLNLLKIMRAFNMTKALDTLFPGEVFDPKKSYDEEARLKLEKRRIRKKTKSRASLEKFGSEYEDES